MITTTVGSYPKVAEKAYGTKLIGAISRWQAKELNDAELEGVQQEITRAVLKEQEQAGLDLLTDGQIRWEDLVTPIARRIEAFEINGLSRWFDNNTYYRRPILHKAPAWPGPILVKDYQFAASCTAKPVKAVLPGPYTFAKVSEDRHYKKERPLVLKLAEILNAEAQALAKAGAPLIQFDEPALGFGAPNLKLAAEALKVATRGVKTKTAVYTYFGELNGAFQALQGTPVDVIGVDVVSAPSTIASLKKAKIRKELGLGCLDGRNTKLESIEDLHALFNAVKRLVPLDRVYVSPSCGLEFLPHTQAQAKVRRVSEAVRAYRNKGAR